MVTADKTESLLDYMISVRRHIHADPELSSEEYSTSAFIERELAAFGLVTKKAHTGLIADIKGKGKGTVAFRADFDALPIAEKTGLPFASSNGNMHACGHDGHTAMLLGAAKYLSAHMPENNVRLIFQFGEEGDGGAETMIGHGATDGVDAVYAFHLCPELDKGRIGTNDSTLFAGVAEFDVIFEGKSAHCASRSEGVDALAAAAEFYKKLDSCRGSRANTLLHVGALAAGTARNVVACAAELKCSFRFFDKADMPPVLDDVRRLIENTDAAFGTTGRLDVRSVYPPLVNDAKCVGRLGKLTELTKTDGRYTAEDFAFYLERVPGCMAWLGVRDEKHDSALHSDTFDFDETVMLTGAELFIKLADTGV